MIFAHMDHCAVLVQTDAWKLTKKSVFIIDIINQVHAEDEEPMLEFEEDDFSLTGIYTIK